LKWVKNQLHSLDGSVKIEKHPNQPKNKRKHKQKQKQKQSNITPLLRYCRLFSFLFLALAGNEEMWGGGKQKKR